MTITPIAVLDHDADGSAILTPKGRTPVCLLNDSSTYSELGWLANLYYVGQLWVHPRFLAARPLKPTSRDPTDERRAAWLSRRWAGTEWRYTLVMPSVDLDSPWLDAPDGRTLLRALELFEWATGTPWQRGAIPTALEMLGPVLKHKGAWERVNLPPPALTGGTEVPLVWERDLTDAELRAGWVHVFDKHAAYLGVCGGLELGLGDPVHGDELVSHELVWERGFSLAPGYWLIRIEGWTGGQWPAELPPPSRTAGWVTTPTLELLLEYGEYVRVLESWTWPRHRRVLRPFYETVGEALLLLRKTEAAPDWPGLQLDRRAATLALGALKDVYAAMLGGGLAQLADRDREPRPPYYRPDWRHHIIAKARANLWRNLETFAGHGLHACRVLNDALYVVSDEPSAQLVAERGGVPLGESMAHYSAKGTYRLGDVLQGRRLSLSRMRRLFE